VSRSLQSVGANATLVAGDVEAFMRRLKVEVEGEIDVAGPELAGSLTDLGLIDEYRLYFRPFVLGRGKPYFAGARPPLRLIAADPVGEDAVRLTYVPACSRSPADRGRLITIHMRIGVAAFGSRRNVWSGDAASRPVSRSPYRLPRSIMGVWTTASTDSRRDRQSHRGLKRSGNRMIPTYVLTSPIQTFRRDQTLALLMTDDRKKRGMAFWATP
jgi:hypothetical protein